jgi:flagellar hook-associated protein 1 FlgK
LSSIFGIDLSALQAFQQAIEVTSNNVANASTPGYDEESIELETALPQDAGGFAIGSGVDVGGRAARLQPGGRDQLNTSQSTLGQLTALQNYTSQIDNLFGTTAGGLTTALQTYYSGWSAVADDPTSTSARQALLGDASALAANLNSTSSQLQEMNSDVNTRITADVNQINSISTQISSLNTQITQSTGSGQTPNQLLDQRDQLVSNLSQLAGVTTTSNSDGSINVYLGNGQPLVLDQNTYAAEHGPEPIQRLAARSGEHGVRRRLDLKLDHLRGPRRPAVGAYASHRSRAQSTGTDRHGGRAERQHPAGLGSRLERPAGLRAVLGRRAGGHGLERQHRRHDGERHPIEYRGLTSDNYLLSYKGGAYTLTDATTGANVALTGAGTSASPLTASSVGLSIVLSGTPASGDQFLIQPTAQAAGPSASRSPTPRALRRRAPSRRRPPTPIPAAPPSARAPCSMPRTPICSIPRPFSS